MINEKIETLTKLECPLLLEKGFDITANGNSVTTGSNAIEGTTCMAEHAIADSINKIYSREEKHKEIGAGSGNLVPYSRDFEPTCPFGHGISNPTPCQARRPPPAYLI